jgi:hypothetical protein
VLLSMPNVGRDDDFERIEDEHEERSCTWLTQM